MRQVLCPCQRRRGLQNGHHRLFRQRLGASPLNQALRGIGGLHPAGGGQCTSSQAFKTACISSGHAGAGKERCTVAGGAVSTYTSAGLCSGDGGSSNTTPIESGVSGAGTGCTNQRQSTEGYPMMDSARDARRSPRSGGAEAPAAADVLSCSSASPDCSCCCSAATLAAARARRTAIGSQPGGGVAIHTNGAATVSVTNRTAGIRRTVRATVAGT